ADRRLEEVAGRRDRDHDLLLRLRQLLDDCPPGHLERVEFELAEQGRELAELGRRREEREATAARAGERLRDLAEEERGLHDERLRLGRAIGRLEPVAAQEE